MIWPVEVRMNVRLAKDKYKNDRGFDVTQRLSMLKGSAKARGINVNLDVNKYQYLIDQGCSYCGSNLSEEKGYCLDRIDNNKGYIISNIVACCKICNRAKSDMTIDDFMEWIKRVNDNMQKQMEQHKKLLSMGITKEIYYKIEELLMQEENKNMEKRRIKHVFTDKD